MDSGLSIFQIILFNNNFKLNLGPEYEAKSTLILVEPWLNPPTQSEGEIKEAAPEYTENLSTYWIPIKSCFMKHFPKTIEDYNGCEVNNYEEMMRLLNTEIPKLKNDLENYQCNFENIFWMTRSLHDTNTYNQLQSNIKNIKSTKLKLQDSMRRYLSIIEDDSLLITYSKYLEWMYRAMTVLCKLAQEPVYTLKMFLRVIEAVVAKKKREMRKKEQEDSGDEEQKGLHDYKQNTEDAVDFDFLYSAIIPSIHAVVCAGYKTENISLFNLLYALEIGKERNDFSQTEHEFFLENMCKLANYKDWRRPDTQFIRITSKVEKSEFLRLKRNLIKIYPKRRSMFDNFDESTINYKDMMSKLHSYFNSEDTEKPTLMEVINLRFICPDDEFRSKICQLVYEELLAIFDFSEDPVKLHSFIKTASWKFPVAVKAFDSINIVNTICSIASFYGVGLEVIRTDALNPILTDKNFQTNQAIMSNFDYTKGGKIKRPEKSQPVILDSKPPQSFSMKYKNGEEETIDKKGVDAALTIIEKCAKNGTWVLISTPEFPTFWRKMCKRLEKIEMVNSFRVFVDLQSIDTSFVPPSFL